MLVVTVNLMNLNVRNLNLWISCLNPCVNLRRTDLNHPLKLGLVDSKIINLPLFSLMLFLTPMAFFFGDKNIL